MCFFWNYRILTLKGWFRPSHSTFDSVQEIRLKLSRQMEDMKKCLHLKTAKEREPPSNWFHCQTALTFRKVYFSLTFNWNLLSCILNPWLHGFKFSTLVWQKSFQIFLSIWRVLAYCSLVIAKRVQFFQPPFIISHHLRCPSFNLFQLPWDFLRHFQPICGAYQDYPEFYFA